MAKHYNFIYEELVRYEGDLVGRVAYSLYKDVLPTHCIKGKRLLL